MKFSKFKVVLAVMAVQTFALIAISMVDLSPHVKEESGIPLALVNKRSYMIDVRTLGELEAGKSISVASSIRTDQPKVIELVEDGVNVNTGDLLVKIDAIPFENKVDELKATILENEGKVFALEQALAWEIEQAEHTGKAAVLEMEVAQLEINKVIAGDGPLEMSRLKSTMQKAKIKYDELNSYSDDLIALEEQGLLNSTEVRLTQKKLQEELEHYENAKSQYESFIHHVHPMQIKKAETALKCLVNKQEEALRMGKFNIEKARLAYTQAQQLLVASKKQLEEAKYELTLTEIRAPSPGMVVLKEEFRNNQRRKPRVGDVLVRNQTILDLPDLSYMIVRTKVREIDLYKVEVGKTATIEVDAYPNLQFPGKVVFIGILAIADPMRPGDEKHFEVRIGLDKTDPRLRPGMTSRVVIHSGSVQDALSVPIHSVFEFDKQHYCYLLEKKYYVMKPVQIGMSNEQWVEIVAGLEENDHVALVMPPESLVVRLENNDG